MIIKSAKFQGHEQASAVINYYDNGITALISYREVVLTIDAVGWLHFNESSYSQTVRKHIYWLMRLLDMPTSTMKRMITENIDINIYTGEERPSRVWI